MLRKKLIQLVAHTQTNYLVFIYTLVQAAPCLIKYGRLSHVALDDRGSNSKGLVWRLKKTRLFIFIFFYWNFGISVHRNCKISVNILKNMKKVFFKTSKRI